VHTGQLFLPDKTSDAVYRSGVYKPHGQPDTTNSADMIYGQAGGHGAQVRITRRPGNQGDRGQITVGVRT
jgi:hypothetical protein